MFLAMNRFTVLSENAEAFEQIWLSRDSRLHELPGFVAFHMLRGPEKDGVVLYASHTVWENEDNFSNWTRSEQFRNSHAKAGGPQKKHEGHPQFEGFVSFQEIMPLAAVDAAE